jgi:hypothetical protein
MSEPLDLAASIRANTAAVQALTALLSQPAIVIAPRQRDDAKAEDEAFAAIKPVKTETAPPAATEVTLDDVKKAATALAKKDRECLAALVKKYESDKVVNINPTFFAAFQRDVEEALA